jgi:hypothetical protein
LLVQEAGRGCCLVLVASAVIVAAVIFYRNSIDKLAGPGARLGRAAHQLVSQDYGRSDQQKSNQSPEGGHRHD